MIWEQEYRFGFEAAHHLAYAVPDSGDHPYAHLHGHSFQVIVTLRTETLTDEGWIVDFAVLKAACEKVRMRLDHQLLNDIPGLERSTLETLASWIYDATKKEVPQVEAIQVARPSLREAVTYKRG